MKALKVPLTAILVTLLTVITQVGGVVFLLSFLTYPLITKRVMQRSARIAVKALSFILIYLLVTFAVVPVIASFTGRVPLPVSETRHLAPASVWTTILNRNYVRPQLRDIAYTVAENLEKKYPGATVNYLDANFPFIDKFPLLPHLSHNDGKKLDLSFQYNDKATGNITHDIPSPIGYGICEEPRDGEVNQPAICASKGFWQYNALRQIVPQGSKEGFEFDNARNMDLINALASHRALGKIFIEPHLRIRLGLVSNKIRFHGCQAVRHDDHIHVQLL